MRIPLLTLALLLALALIAPASDLPLENRRIRVDPPFHTSSNVPIVLPCDVDSPEQPVVLTHLITGQSFPATIRDGALVFVAGSLPSYMEHVFEVTLVESMESEGVRVTPAEDEKALEVYIRDQHFTTYRYAEEHRIPFLWPLHAEDGVTITRNWPMNDDDPVASTDHPHHVSFWTAFGDVNGHDTWHDTPIVTQTIEYGSGQAYGWIRAQNQWRDGDDSPLVDETREYRFYNTPASDRLFDHTVTFTATYGDVTFGDDKEGMVAFRIRPEIQGNQAGVLTNADGARGESNVYGKPVPWMDYSGSIEGVGTRGLALFSHLDNLRQPYWHVRDYGLAAANPFAMSDVGGLNQDGSYTLKEGESLTFQFRVFVHSGDVKEARVDDRYADYVTPPEATWTE